MQRASVVFAAARFGEFDDDDKHGSASSRSDGEGEGEGWELEGRAAASAATKSGGCASPDGRGHPCAHSLSRVVCMGGAGVGAGAGAGAGWELLWCACRLGGSADTEDWLQSSPLAAAAPSAHQPVAALPARAAAARTGRAFSGEFSRHSSQSTVLQGGPRDRAEVGARGRAAEAPE